MEHVPGLIAYELDAVGQYRIIDYWFLWFSDLCLYCEVYLAFVIVAGLGWKNYERNASLSQRRDAFISWVRGGEISYFRSRDGFRGKSFSYFRVKCLI